MGRVAGTTLGSLTPAQKAQGRREVARRQRDQRRAAAAAPAPQGEHAATHPTAPPRLAPAPTRIAPTPTSERTPVAAIRPDDRPGPRGPVAPSAGPASRAADFRKRLDAGNDNAHLALQVRLNAESYATAPGGRAAYLRRMRSQLEAHGVSREDIVGADAFLKGAQKIGPHLVGRLVSNARELPAQFGTFALGAAVNVGTDVAHPVRIAKAAASDVATGATHPLRLAEHPGRSELARHSRLVRGTITPLVKSTLYMLSPGPVIVGGDAKGPIYRAENGGTTRDVKKAQRGIAAKIAERPLDYLLLAKGGREVGSGALAKGQVGGKAFAEARAGEAASPLQALVRGAAAAKGKLEPGEFTYRTRSGAEATVRTPGNPARQAAAVRRRTAVVKATTAVENVVDRELPVGEHARAVRLLAKGQRRAQYAEQQRALAPFDRAFRGLKPHENVAVVLRAIGGKGAQGMKPSELLAFVRQRQHEDAARLEEVSLKLESPDLGERARGQLVKERRRLRGALRDHERMAGLVSRVSDELHASVDTKPHLRTALDAARTLTAAGGDALERAGKLSPESRALRPYLTLRVVRGARYREVSPSKALVDARRHERRIARAVERAGSRRDRNLTKQVAKLAAEARVPHTIETATARLRGLEVAHEKHLTTMEKSLLSRPVTPDEATRLLAEHDAKIAAAQAAVEHLRTASTHRGAIETRTAGQIARENAARVTVAERALVRLTRERRQYADALKTGNLVTRLDPRETARRNLQRLGGMKMPTQREELRAELVRRIEETAARNPEHPAVKNFTGRAAEIDRLKRGLDVALERSFEGRALTGEQLGRVLGHREHLPPGVIGNELIVPMVRSTGGYLRARGQANFTRLNSALSVARDRVRQLEEQHIARYGAAPEKRVAAFVGGPEAEGLIRDVHDVIYFGHSGPQLREGARPQGQSGRVPAKVPGATKLNKGVRLLASRWLPTPAGWRDSYLQAIGYSHAIERGSLAFQVGERVGANGERHEGWYYVRRGPAKPSRAADERSTLEQEAQDFLGHERDLEAFVKSDVATRDPAVLRQWEEQGTGLADVRQISPADNTRLFGDFKGSSELLRRLYDRPTDFWRGLTLTYRPAWVVNNLVGQTLLYALNHSGPGGAKAYAAAIADEVRGKDAQKRYFPDELLGGFIKSEASTRGLTPGALGRVDGVRDARGLRSAIGTVLETEARIRDRIQRVNASLSDNIPRRAAWYRVVQDNRNWINRQLGTQHTFNELLGELQRVASSAEHKPELAGKATVAPREARLRKLHDELVQQVHRQLVDFNDLGTRERAVMRRIVPFYSWVKGITKALGHFGYEHPLKALLMAEGARNSQDQLQERIGKGAAVLSNVLPIGRPVDRGRGPEQDVLSTAGLNPLQTVADLAGKTAGTFERNPLSPSDNPILLANPLIQAIGAAAYRKDAFSGSDLSARGGAGGILASQVATSFPEIALAQRLLGRQYPTTKQGKPHLTVPDATFHGVPYDVLNYLGVPLKRKNLAAATAIVAGRGPKVPTPESDYRASLKESALFARGAHISGGVPPEIKRQLGWQRDLALAKDKAKADLRVSKLPPAKVAEITAATFVRLHPQARDQVLGDLKRLPKLDDAYRQFSSALVGEALHDLRQWDSEKSSWMKARRERAAGFGVGAP